MVAIHMPNRPAYYATLLAGATFSPVNPLLPARDVAFQLADSGAAAVVTWGPAAQVIDGVAEHTALRLVIGVDTGSGMPFEEFLDGHPQTPPDVEIDVYRDLAHIAYTGDTTGRSKGVELPHHNVRCSWPARR